jgi:hypothetical protein
VCRRRVIDIRQRCGRRCWVGQQIIGTQKSFGSSCTTNISLSYPRTQGSGRDFDQTRAPGLVCAGSRRHSLAVALDASDVFVNVVCFGSNGKHGSDAKTGRTRRQVTPKERSEGSLYLVFRILLYPSARQERARGRGARTTDRHERTNDYLAGGRDKLWLFWSLIVWDDLCQCDQGAEGSFGTTLVHPFA